MYVNLYTPYQYFPTFLDMIRKSQFGKTTDNSHTVELFIVEGIEVHILYFTLNHYVAKSFWVLAFELTSEINLFIVFWVKTNLAN